jgi:DNA helicase-2/ATP-dependent DNA helicase PcrA
MALTFTNKAAKEMRERVEKVVGSDARNLWMGTFHSVFARMLRAEAHYLGYPSNFTIYDTDDSKTLDEEYRKGTGLDEVLTKPEQYTTESRQPKINSSAGRSTSLTLN